jgi:hypothetical protein
MSKGNEKSISENLQEAFQIKRPLADDDPDGQFGPSGFEEARAMSLISAGPVRCYLTMQL